MSCFTKNELTKINNVVKRLGMKIPLSEKIELINSLQLDLKSNYIFQNEKIMFIEANKTLQETPKIKLNIDEIKYATTGSVQIDHLESELKDIMKRIRDRNDYFNSIIGNNVNSISRVKDALKALKESGNDGIVTFDKTYKYIYGNGKETRVHFSIKEKNNTIRLLESAIRLNNLLQNAKKDEKNKVINSGGIVTPITVDGNNFIAIHSEKQMRVFYADSGKIFGIFFTEESDIDDRKNELNKLISDHLDKRFKNVNEYPNDNRNLPNRIQQVIREKYPIDDNGDFHIARKMFSVDKESGLFANYDTPFSKLFKLVEEGNDEEYKNILNEITEFMPSTIKDILIGERNGEKAKEFVDAMRYFIAAMNALNVPAEKVWTRKYKLSDIGAFETTNNSTINTPNYLELLGKFETEDQEFILEDGTSVKVPYKTLVLDKNIDEIIKFYSIKAMADMNKMLSDLSNENDSDIAKNMNIEIYEVQKMRNLISQNILPASSFIQDAAADALSQIGIKINVDINMDIKAGLEATIASLIKNTMQQSMFVDYVSSKDAIKNEQLEVSRNLIEAGATEKEIFSEFEKIEDRYRFKENNFSFFRLNKKAFGSDKEDYKKTFLAVNKLKYISVNSQRSFPSLEPISDVRTRMVKSSYESNPNILHFIEEQQQIKWVFNDGIKELYKEYNEIKNIEDKEERTRRYNDLLISLGYEEIGNDTHHISEINKIIGNNDKIVRELEILMNYYSDKNMKKGFYLPWGQVSNGRAQIMSDMNPQESKLIRSFVGQIPAAGSPYAGHFYFMTKKDFNSDSKTFQMMVYAISQGLDMDPDKSFSGTILKRVSDEIFEIKNGKLLFKGSSETGSEVGKIIETLILNKPTGREKAELLNRLFNKTEGHHGLQTYRMLNRMYEWFNGDMKKPFVNDLTIETDAITSGFILTIMQILGDDASKFLAKGGIYNQEMYEKWNSYTKKWIAIKLLLDGKIEDPENIEFTPSALIEAGNFHQSLIEDTELLNEVKNLTDKHDSFTDDKIDEYMKEEVFQDLYKTIGIEMQDKVNQKKIEIDNSISDIKRNIRMLESINIGSAIENKSYIDTMKKRYENELNYAMMIQSMLNSIGKITPKKLRAIAKDPVMVYIYGSQISTIRQKLGITVGVNEFIKAIKIYNEYLKSGIRTDEAIMAENFINNTLKVYAAESKLNFKIRNNKNNENGVYNKYNIMSELSFSKYDKDEGVVKLNYNSIKNTNLRELLMNMEIDETFIKILSGAVNDTFGDAIESAFEILDFVDEYRDEVKSIELITFELFKARTDVIRENIIKDNGVITQKDFNDMVKNLEINGYGHDSPDGSAYGYNNRIPLMKMEKTAASGQASVSITLNKDIIKDGSVDKSKINIQKRIYSYLNNKTFIANANGSSTVTIHKQDSNLITYTIDANAWLSIYDAIVQASHPKNVKESTDVYNRQTFVENAQRDIRGDNLRKLIFMLGNLKERMKSSDEQIKKKKKKEYELFKNRLSVAEQAKVREYTVTGNDLYTKEEIKKFNMRNPEGKKRVETTLIEISKTNKTAKVLFDHENKAVSSLYVDVQDTVFKNGKRVIKEVYYGPIENNKKKITKTVYKTIDNNIMKVTESVAETVGIKFSSADGKHDGEIDSTRAQRNAERDMLVKKMKSDMKYNTLKGVEKTKADKKIKEELHKKYPITKRIAFKVSYIIEGKENIDAFNDFKNKDKKIEINDLKTIMISLQDGELINTISGEKAYNTDAIPSKEYTSIEPVPGNHDIQNDIVRTGLPIESMLRNIERINDKRKMKEKSLNQVWRSGHSGTANTGTVKIDPLNIKFDEIDITLLTEELNSILNNNEINSAEFVESKLKEFKKYNKEQIDNFNKNRKKDKSLVEPVLYQNIDIIEELLAESGSREMYFYNIGGSENDNINSSMKAVNKFNHKGYHENSIVAISIFDEGNSLKTNGEFTSSYKNIRSVIKAGSEIITYRTPKRMVDIAKAANIEYTTNSFLLDNAIRRAIKINGYEKIPKEYRREANILLINNKIRELGYIGAFSDNKNFINWKPIKMRYNKTVKNSIDLSMEVRKMLQTKEGCK